MLLNILDIITRDAVRIVYQPIYDLKLDRVIGYEALARGPEDESPMNMFAEARKVGLVREFDLQCLNKGLAYGLEGIMFVNVQPMTLLYMTKKLVGLPDIKRTVVIEIVEIEDIPCNYKDEFLLCVKMLKKMGYRIAIDDIFSGFNRLELVYLLQPDFIKIDGPLLNGSGSSVVVLESIVGMAKELKIKTVAEDIEDEGRLELVKDLGVDFGQGFLLGEPRLAGRELKLTTGF